MPTETGGRTNRHWTWWALTALYLVLLLWWPISIIGSVYSIGAIAGWQTVYLLATSVAYPVFLLLAVWLSNRAHKAGKRAIATLLLLIPFASGTWITAVILIPALLMPI